MQLYKIFNIQFYSDNNKIIIIKMIIIIIIICDLYIYNDANLGQT